MLALCLGGGSPLWEQRHRADHPFPVLVLNSWYQEFSNIQMQAGCARQPQHSEEIPASPGACGATKFPMEAALLTPNRQQAGATPSEGPTHSHHGLCCLELAPWVLSATGLFLILRSLWGWTPWESWFLHLNNHCCLVCHTSMGFKLERVTHDTQSWNRWCGFKH